MLDSFVYEDHLGRRFVGLDNGVYLNYSELRDYSWSHETLNGRISRFYRDITSRKIPLVIKCDTQAKADEARNKLLDLCETDIEAMIPGKIYIGDYYTSGYITESLKSNYLINKNFCNIELSLTSEDAFWYKEKTYRFFPENADSATVMGGTDYPYDYPYDYALSVVGSQINCDSVRSSAFRITVYGAITDPAVVISGHTYKVNGTVESGETLVIDSLNKTITLNKADGQKVNWFDNRDRAEYIFEPIPKGENIVGWSGMFGFNLTVIEKRSEPRWT